MKRKPAKLIGLLLCLTFFLSACEGEEALPSDGGMLFLSSDEVGQYETSGREGFFVLNEDKTFTPLCASMTGFSKMAKEEDRTRFLWYTDNLYSITDLVPHVNKDKKLVILGNSSGSIPATITIEKYEDRGITLGLHIYKDDAGKMYLIPKEYLSTSDGSKAGDLSSEKKVEIVSVNGSEIPLGNIDNNIEMLLGLEDGKYYTFGFYIGTKYQELEVKADTKVLQSEGVLTVSNPYISTKEGYFIVNLPANMAKGYYYVNNAGILYYEGE